MACLAEAAKSCRPARLLDVVEMNAMGAMGKITTEWVIVGMGPDGCVMTSATKDAALKMTDVAKDMMRKSGMNDAAIDAAEREMSLEARSKAQDQRCVMAPAALSTAFREMGQGQFSSAHWQGCTRPNAACPGEAPTPAAGCLVGACTNGGWPVTCGGQKCVMEGTVLPGSKVACENGSISVSFGM